METKLFSITKGSNLSTTLLDAADIIKSGGLVVFPTETVYGLGADAFNGDAVKKIFIAKGRPSDNPLIVHIEKPSDIEKLTTDFTKNAKLLAEAFMPGLITVILPSRDNIPLATRAGLPTVAVRCPENKIARALISAAGVPIAAPSANLSGSPSPTSFKHVVDDMNGRCDVIIDGGDCDFGLESTIVKIDGDGAVTLLRPGRITVGDLESIGITVRVADAVVDKLGEGEVALSPGMKYRHYAPGAELILLEGSREACARYIKGVGKERVALISHTDDVEYYKGELPTVIIYDFGLRGDMAAQAHRLFSILRSADKEDFDLILAPLPEKDGIGLALYNRMIRAAAHKIIRL